MSNTIESSIKHLLEAKYKIRLQENEPILMVVSALVEVLKWDEQARKQQNAHAGHLIEATIEETVNQSLAKITTHISKHYSDMSKYDKRELNSVIDAGIEQSNRLLTKRLIDINKAAKSFTHEVTKIKIPIFVVIVINFMILILNIYFLFTY